MLAMLLICVMCARQSVHAFSLKQINSVDSVGLLSNSFLVPPLAALLRSKVSELPPSQIATKAIETAAVGLEGYIITKLSNDYSCNEWDLMETQQLNSCRKERNGQYTRLTATSTEEVNENTYTDSKCATAPKSQKAIRLADCYFGISYVYSSVRVLPCSRPFAKMQ